MNSKGIYISTTTPQTSRYSLIQQGACPPQSISKYEECTQNVANSKGWVNYNVAAFSYLQCDNTPDKTTQNGLYVYVEGNGAEIDGYNSFNIEASLIY